MAERSSGSGAERVTWPWGVSLTARILAVNVIALGLLAGSLFYLDSYRNNLLEERFALARAEAQITAAALENASRRQRRGLLARIGEERRLRLRLYNAKGKLVGDSFALAGRPSFQFTDPASEPWYQHAARVLDRGMDLVLGAPTVETYADTESKEARAWPEIEEARTTGATALRHRLAPDRTPAITAAAPVGTAGEVLLTTRNASDITQQVRDARQTLAIIVGTALLVSINLSLFLARTIVQPLRKLVRAAIRVRLGRDREVVVPRLPDRRDELGMLARAISDMTAALRHRIDAVESFAADVAHEIKNPLASLRSSLESMGTVEDRALREQLAGIAMHDVQRIDRLVTEIADASRIDAELSRTPFEPVAIFDLVNALVAGRRSRGIDRGCDIAVSPPAQSDCTVPGDAARLERVMENLIDNAVSFSPPGGRIDLELICDESRVHIAVSDQGPGIDPGEREKVFERFHSVRPSSEDFGRHSGLGLAIARTIVEAHSGTLTAHDRPDGRPGARLEIDLPAWREELR